MLPYRRFHTVFSAPESIGRRLRNCIRGKIPKVDAVRELLSDIEPDEPREIHEETIDRMKRNMQMLITAGQGLRNRILAILKNIIYRLNCSNQFHFAEHIFWKSLYSYTGTGRILCKVPAINFVKCCKIAHISKKAGCFYNVFK